MASTSTISVDPATTFPSRRTGIMVLKRLPDRGTEGRGVFVPRPPGITATWLVSAVTGRTTLAGITESIVRAVIEAPMRPYSGPVGKRWVEIRDREATGRLYQQGIRAQRDKLEAYVGRVVTNSR